MLIAMTRGVSPAFEQCQLTHIPRVNIELDLARSQHEEYEDCLRALGCTVQRVASGPEIPDSVFIEDTAVVFDELALITRPGAPLRRLETRAVEESLEPYRTILRIEPPGTLDGGDVVQVGKRIFVGQSSRTNFDAVGQMQKLLGMHGYSVHPVTVRGCLHLKTAVTCIREDTLLINREWVSVDDFPEFDLIDVHPDERFGANALRIGERIIYPSSFPRTRKLMEQRGFEIEAVGVEELGKAEGGVTCCSLVFNT